MPVLAPDIKVQAVKRLGGTVKLVGETYTETQQYAQVNIITPSRGHDSRGQAASVLCLILKAPGTCIQCRRPSC